MGTEGIVTTSSAAQAKRPHRSPSLDAQLEKVRGQLQDWVTCPSSKTPEGQAKIREVTAKFEEVQRQIKKADEAQGQRTPGTAPSVIPVDGESSDGSRKPRPFRLDAPMGGYLDLNA